MSAEWARSSMAFFFVAKSSEARRGKMASTAAWVVGGSAANDGAVQNNRNKRRKDQSRQGFGKLSPGECPPHRWTAFPEGFGHERRRHRGCRNTIRRILGRFGKAIW